MFIDIPDSCPGLTSRHLDDITVLAAAGVDDLESPIEATQDPFWAGLRAIGTELWLDTGDIEAASGIWTADFTALTTNNSLLNTEIQKGIYDAWIPKVAMVMAGLPGRRQILEVAFALNARHGLRLVRRFGTRVSVELHTDLADDSEASIFYGRRYHAICPDRFIVKVPMTPSGLIAAKRLGEDGIPVNFTLGFSARQSHLAAGFTRPAWVNVFLGRLGAYVADNGLGVPEGVGEKALLASQRAVRAVGDGQVKQIAASMRAGDQVGTLAGTDVYTMPVKVATAARQDLPGTWTDRTGDEPVVSLAPVARHARVESAWEVGDIDRRLLATLRNEDPADAATLVDLVHQAGGGDLFPRLTDEDQAVIAADGKIPVHAHWADRIAANELAPDTLLRLAGLAAFAQDQAKLDARIRGLIG